MHHQIIEAIDSRINIGLHYAFKLQEYAELTAELYLSQSKDDQGIMSIVYDIENTGDQLKESIWSLDRALDTLSDDDPILELVQDLGMEMWEITQVTMKLIRSVDRHDEMRTIQIRVRDVQETYASIHESYRRLIAAIGLPC